MNLFSNNSFWCWHPDVPLYKSCFLLFRRTFTATDGKSILKLAVTADNRYTLYLDGDIAGRGPCRSDTRHYRYETYEIPVTPGEHTLLARVAIFPQHGEDGESWSLIAEMHHGGGFLAAGGLFTGGEKTEAMDTPSGWQVRHEAARKFRTVMAENTARHAVVPAMEHFFAAAALRDEADGQAWKTPVKIWRPATAPVIGDPASRWWLSPRTIPMLAHAPEKFRRIIHARGTENARDLLDGKPFSVPAGQTATLTLDIGHLSTVFPRMAARGAEGSSIRIRYSESLYVDGKKHIRDDPRGVVAGYSDRFDLAPEAVEFEPFWFRTCRFVEVEITTPATGGAVIQSFTLQSWMYPFELKGEFTCADPEIKTIWDVAWRTARLCAHEHYEDCPYYEQLQYAGDTRIQALISYMATGDGRLGRQAIEQFDQSRLPEGLTQSRYPSNWTQVIPSFSLYWVMMVHDYHRYFGDRAFTASMLHGIDAVLDFFERQRGPDGLLRQAGYWGYHDWVPDWIRGDPSRGTGLPVTLDSLLHAEACRMAAELHRACGRPERAQELDARRRLNLEAVNRLCIDPASGLYTDVPGVANFSQHTNAMAILAEATTGPDARKLADAIVTRPDMSQATLYYSFYLLRAWEKTGCYRHFWTQLDKWRDMLKLNFSTFPEIPSPDSRSDCHAWSSTPIHELLACVLGIQPDRPGFAALRLAPATGPWDHAKGKGCAGGQMAEVEWWKKNGELRIRFSLEKAIPVTIAWPDGTLQDMGTTSGGDIRHTPAG
jgi:alpha-L-rhamnosidase